MGNAAWRKARPTSAGLNEVLPQAAPDELAEPHGHATPPRKAIHSGKPRRKRQVPATTPVSTPRAISERARPAAPEAASSDAHSRLRWWPPTMQDGGQDRRTTATPTSTGTSASNTSRMMRGVVSSRLAKGAARSCSLRSPPGADAARDPDRKPVTHRLPLRPLLDSGSLRTCTFAERRMCTMGMCGGAGPGAGAALHAVHEAVKVLPSRR